MGRLVKAATASPRICNGQVWYAQAARILWRIKKNPQMRTQGENWVAKARPARTANNSAAPLPHIPAQA
jgi:hypothetical protein